MDGLPVVLALIVILKKKKELPKKSQIWSYHRTNSTHAANKAILHFRGALDAIYHSFSFPEKKICTKKKSGFET
jgi:hypothetical protein